MSIDISMLEKVRHHASGKITARCPACAEQGGDRAGNNFVLFPDDRYACAAQGGDSEHRKRIMTLAGISGNFHEDPVERRKRSERNVIEQQRKLRAHYLSGSARAHRSDLLRRFAWERADAWDDSPQRIDSEHVETDPRHFLASLFRPFDVLWTGEVHHSGSSRYAERWKRCHDWHTDTHPIGPMTTPAIWRPGSLSRTAANVLSAPYTVLDFDGLDGIKPVEGDDLSRHILDSLALIRWLREKMNWRLAAILSTGGKSLHAWFHALPIPVLQSLYPFAKVLGVDLGLIGRPEHPCRLPGQIHSATGRVSGVLWLQLPPLDTPDKSAHETPSSLP